MSIPTNFQRFAKRFATLAAARRCLVSVALLVAATSVAACGSSGSGTGASSPARARDPRVAALLPASVRARHTLTIVTEASVPPIEFVASDGHTIVGFDVDIGHALGRVMGLKVNFQGVPFDSIVPGLAAGKYDLAMAGIAITKARERVVNLVSYFTDLNAFYVSAKGGPQITGLADLCGHSVAVQEGTIQASDAIAQNEKCKAAGKPGVEVKVYSTQNEVNLALTTGRQQVSIIDQPVAVYIVKKSGGRLKLTGKPYEPAPMGIAIPKGSGMAKPVLAALKVLMARGEYLRILKKWDVAQGAISKPAINPKNVNAS
jgi:polar amino acid transport system substrate-binding protein